MLHGRRSTVAEASASLGHRGRIPIENAAVVTMDPALGDFERANILIEDGRIAAVQPGPGADVSRADAERIDASTMIAMPRAWSTPTGTPGRPALRGILADGNIPDYLRGIRLQMARAVPRRGHVRRQLPRRPGCARTAGSPPSSTTATTSSTRTVRMRRSPACATPASAPSTRTASPRSRATPGARATARAAESIDPPTLPPARLAREIRETYFPTDDGLLRFGMAPQELAIAPVAAVALEFGLARELGARITFHANQVVVRQLFKDVEVLHANGLLGDDLLLVHRTFNTPEEWAMLEGSGTMVSVCAETEMQMGMGYPAIAEVTAHTPGPSLGIDRVSGCGGDMISHSRLVLQATRYRADEPGYREWKAPQVMSWTTKDALTWLTVNGAKAAGLGDEVGSLTPGKRADVVLLEMGGVSQAGWNRSDPAGAIIAQAHAGCVDTVLVAGRVVKRGGTLVHVDLPAALAKLEASHDYLYGEMSGNGGFIPQPPIDIPLYRERA